MHFISIIGPTAIGKTKLGVAVSKIVGGEVISVDSLQCYKAGSIVTAKVGNEEADGVAHYLVDYLQAYEEPNDFVAQAIDKIEEIENCGHIPVLVGGSTSLIIPLLLAASERGFQHFTILLWSPILSLQPRIEERVEDMIGSGLLNELRELKRLEKEYLGTPNFEKGVWKAIGYKELYPCLEALDGDENHDLLRECLTSMKQNTVDYAITQLRWMQQTLIPLLAQLQVPSVSLRVNGGVVWKDEVEIPALRMVNGFRNNAAPAKEISLVAPLKMSNSSKRPTICVFCGSSAGTSPAYIEAARSLAYTFHQRNIHLVYGGGTTGIMGALAHTLVSLSGPSAVTGIIPEALVKYEQRMRVNSVETYKDEFGSRTVVKDMHARKHLMVQNVINGGPGSGFVALSGGYGTAEELMEVTTWSQLGIHNFGVCVFNINGFYDGLLSWVKKIADEGFVPAVDAKIIMQAYSAEEVVESLGAYVAADGKAKLDWE